VLKSIINFVAFVAIIYVAICVLLFFLQRSLIYYPQPRAKGERSATMPLSVPGAELVISLRAHDGPNAIVYFGGNGEDVAYNLPDISMVESGRGPFDTPGQKARILPGLSTTFPDHALYLMNYRGYGGSTGMPTEQAIHQDAQALFDWVQARHPQVVVMGRSLGSGVAIRLASERPASRLVLITPYSSIVELGARQFPYFPVRWLMQDKYESWRYAPQITVPTLLIAAENDEVIPRASTDDLYSRFKPGVAALQVIPGVGHNTISNSPLYFTSLRSGAGL
jgi:pimeloyl-ACP methyl ester carboxylesterase